MNNVLAAVCGLLFGVGLAMSGMTDTAKVQGFLDLFGAWVPDLAFVMGGAVLVTLAFTRPVLKRARPLFAAQFDLPANKQVDRKLVLGALCFGVGWGLYGYCPGPAVAALAYLQWHTLVFVVLMLCGMWLADKLKDRF